jgi:threonylcarbamoyladenosine tRNA methylthiotransferase MtaB
VAGCRPVEDAQRADVCVIHTCTVTHVAARKSRQLVRRCAKVNPHAKIIVTGCYAEMSPAEASALPGVVLLLGTTQKDRLVPEVLKVLRPTAEPDSVPPHPPAKGHTRAFVKIQDGCDNECTYCIVRLARGRQRSRSELDILDDILSRQAEGYQEVVLTGVHIGAYGRDRGGRLSSLVEHILSHTQISRLRLSSIEPWDWSPDLLRLWEDERLCRHLHLPLQSGCDATLERMRRRYTTQQFAALVSRVRHAVPDVAITTDLIVGFPGEDEAEFSASRDFVREMGFAQVHLFPFSARPGTEATIMPNQVAPATKRERMEGMSSLVAESALAFRRQFVGRELRVLWETRGARGWSGLTDNYIRVFATSDRDLHNRIRPTHLVAVVPDGMAGEVALS